MKIKLIFFAFLLILSSLLSPIKGINYLTAFAANDQWTDGPTIKENTINEPNVAANVNKFLGNITNYIVGFVIVLAVFFIVYAGFQYITSAGNEKKTEKAKKTLTYAILGLVVILLVYVVLGLITKSILPNIFGSGTTSI